MEQNNFEKNVQQKMDELKIAPSDSVWKNVEKRIGGKQKDRKVIFILFFLFLFLLSGGYWLLNSTKNNQKKNQQISNVIKTERDSKATNKEDSSFQKSEIILHKNAANNKSGSVSSKKIKSSAINSGNKTKKKKQQKKVGSIEEFTSKHKADFSKRMNNEDSQIALYDVGKLIEKNDAIFPTGQKNLNEILKDSSQNKVDIISLSNQLKTRNLIGKSIAIHKINQNKDSAKPHKNPWNFGITFSSGSSSIGSNILERNYPPPDISSGFPPGGNPSYYHPSPIKTSTAFISGVFLEKNISPKSRFSLGVSYKYFSLINKVGNKIDSIVSSGQYSSFSNRVYSSSNTIHSYRNNFHYLEVPITIKLQLNKSKKLPLSWNAGVNISQLISSNALQFQSNPGIYYNDNSLLNKTQFGLHLGFTATLFSKEKMPVTFGPYFYYGTSSLAGKGLYDGKHFNFIGIRTEILFHKK
jgi:hypothetical protein